MCSGAGFALVSHDLEHATIGFIHGLFADFGQIANAAVHAVVDDALDGGDAFALHGEHGREHGGRNARGEFEGARGFGAVADHAGEIGDHILDSRRHFFVIAAHEIGDAAGAAGSGHHTTAKCRECAEMLLDVDGSEVGEHERADKFGMRVVVFAGEDGHGVRARKCCLP